ncbi:hypothetical protein Q6D67_12160 [Haliea sp. E1-2-M8]|uniref:hypothetical protein n=1 Tax=Haliea sp. E1-2-M8 TaxID=3064706 RepID=UPI0027159D81|nr:hypothetical protein [Haliea sp. E1-2-M8]MDO8862455.1 hypothetical protein [Haliea sp. E1-2-M8]
MRSNIAVHMATAVVFLSIIGTSEAQDDINVVTYAEFILADYSLEQDGTILIPNVGVLDLKSAFRVNPAALKVGSGITWRDWYASVYFQGTNDASDSFTVPFIGDITYTGNRKEWVGALGYQLQGNTSIFLGYRDSKIEGNGSPAASFTFESDGFFLGASYWLPLIPQGGLTFTFAHAWLDGSAKQEVSGGPVNTGTGSGTGVKFGVGWRGDINEDWGYSINVDSFTYKHDTRSDNVNVDIEESEITFGIGLSYAF